MPLTRRIAADDPQVSTKQVSKTSRAVATPNKDKQANSDKDKPKVYQKLTILGQGTYGTVYKALNKETNELVAVKKLHLANVKDGVPTTTIRELSALMYLAGHENIVALNSFKFDIEKNLAKPKLFLELEYCDCDLRMFCKRFPERRLPIKVVEKIVKDIVIGTAYCHSNRIIHRDLKPSNVLVKFHIPIDEVIAYLKNGRWDESWITVKLADFGLARTHYSFNAPLTHEVITLWYRAPEIILGEDGYGTGVDTWSIGCIIAELLYGRPLFTGDTEIHTLYKMFQFLGTPNPSTWPGIVNCPEYKSCWPKWEPLRNKWEKMRPDLISSPDESSFKRLVDFADKALKINPDARAHIHELACHPFMQME